MLIPRSPLQGELPQAEGGSLGQRNENGVQHDSCRCQHFMIPESQHTESTLCQVGVPLRVVRFGLRVLTSVEFDDQARLQAREVSDIGTDRMLSAETVTAQCSSSEMLP